MQRGPRGDGLAVNAIVLTDCCAPAREQALIEILSQSVPATPDIPLNAYRLNPP
jgi:hypothetical protein